MSDYDREFWEERWSQALREHGDRVAQRPPSGHLTAEAGDLPPGRALDAGCGHGSDAVWLAARGWQVTAVDFAATALARARSTAEARRGRAHLEAARAVLDPGRWELIVAEDRSRPTAGTGVDAVIRARRRF